MEHVTEQEAEPEPSDISTVAAPSEHETPATSQAPSESELLQPEASAQPTSETKTQSRPDVGSSHARKDTRTAVPIVPAIPHVPRAKVASPAQKEQVAPETTTTADSTVNDAQTADLDQSTKEDVSEVRAVPKSWADLVRSKNSAAPAAALINGAALANGASNAKGGSLGEVLDQFAVGSEDKIAFLEPRGLVNTGNMCYMNSVRPIRLLHTLSEANRRRCSKF